MGGRSRPQVGDVVEIPLSADRSAYGRILKDAGIAIYDTGPDFRGSPPIGSRDYLFVVGIYEDAVRKLRVVAKDESTTPAEDWPPPSKVVGVVSGGVKIYHLGEMRKATPAEADHLEPAAVWDIHHTTDRIEALID